MARLARHRSVPMTGALGVLAALATACSLDDVAFRCDHDSQCVKSGTTGICEPSGYCSFSDSSCTDTGRRYGDQSPKDLSGECVKPCIVQISPGGLHTCARLASGQLRCWGAGLDGQLGNGSTALEQSSIPVEVDSQVEPAAQVSAGDSHTCSVRSSDGTVFCWGSNKQFQLGVPANVTGPIQVPFGPAQVTAVQVAAGVAHTCARGGDGLACWGNNLAGQIGNGQVSEKQLPVGMPLPLQVLEVAVGGAHSCARPSVTSLRCWGSNQVGQVGAPDLQNPALQLYDTNLPATAVSLGALHSCALLKDEVRCWGANNDLQLGADRLGGPLPLKVELEAGVKSLSAGYLHTCVVLVDGRITCWGANQHGQLGPSAAVGKQSLPSTFSLPEPAVEVSAGGQHTCALTTAGRAYCWGRNDLGQLGNGSTESTSTPDPAITNALCR